MELDPVAREIVLRSIRQAIPSDWRAKCEELRSLGDVDLQTYLLETGLEIEDVYANNRSWSALRRTANLPPKPAARMRIRCSARSGDYCTSMTATGSTPTDHSSIARLLPTWVASAREHRFAVDVDRFTGDCRDAGDAARELCASMGTPAGPQRAARTPGCAPRTHRSPARTDRAWRRTDRSPRSLHACRDPRRLRDRNGCKTTGLAEGVLWDEASSSDLFAFTLDKSAGSFSPTTRYRDYAISSELIHWESQSGTSLESPTGRRYTSQAETGTNVVLFARISAVDRAFWCLGPATYISHEGERPIAITWRLHNRLPGDLFAEFAAAVA